MLRILQCHLYQSAHPIIQGDPRCMFIVFGTSNLICFHTVFRTCHTACELFVKVLSPGLNVTGMYLL